jgi:hypothetical protein
MRRAPPSDPRSSLSAANSRNDCGSDGGIRLVANRRQHAKPKGKNQMGGLFIIIVTLVVFADTLSGFKVIGTTFNALSGSVKRSDKTL